MSDAPRWHCIEATRGLGDELLGEIESRLHYCGDDILDSRIAADPQRLEVLPGKPLSAEVRATLEEVASTIASGHTPRRPRIVFDRRGESCTLHENVYEELVASGEIVPHAPGRVTLCGRPLELRERLDTLFLDIAEEVGAVPQGYPTLLSVDVLERCDYFSSFPQYLTFACHLREDLGTLRSFSERLRHGQEICVDDGTMAPPREVLSPTVCFHCYEQLQDSLLPVDGGAPLTARNHCYRYEAGNLRGLERLWDFSMREVVLFGPPARVREQLAQLRSATEVLVDELGLYAWIENANDAFFIDDFAKKAAFQNTFDLKYELRLTIPGGSLAAASFNYHNDFFCKAYGIRLADGGPIASACIGFGLERFLYGVLAQCGAEASEWPEILRQGVTVGTR